MARSQCRDLLPCPGPEAEELGTFETNRHPFRVVLVVVRGEGLLLGECLDLHRQCSGPGLGPRGRRCPRPVSAEPRRPSRPRRGSTSSVGIAVFTLYFSRRSRSPSGCGATSSPAGSPDQRQTERPEELARFIAGTAYAVHRCLLRHQLVMRQRRTPRPWMPGRPSRHRRPRPACSRHDDGWASSSPLPRSCAGKDGSSPVPVRRKVVLDLAFALALGVRLPGRPISRCYAPSPAANGESRPLPAPGGERLALK
jgi:hypothetical protein